MNEKEILDNFTEWAIRYNQMSAKEREYHNRSFDGGYSKLDHQWIKIENYKSMDEMLKLYLAKEKELEEIKKKWNDPEACYSRSYQLSFNKFGGNGSISIGPDKIVSKDGRGKIILEMSR